MLPKKNIKDGLEPPCKEKFFLIRKRNGYESKREYNKDSYDNIIKKINGILFKNVIDYMISYINEFKSDKKQNSFYKN